MSGVGRLQPHLLLKRFCGSPAPSYSLGRILISFVRHNYLDHNNNNNSNNGGSYDASPLIEKRVCRRRYSAANTRGRSGHIYSIISFLKTRPKAEATALFDKLSPRNKLDILRTLAKRCRRRSAGISTYKSRLFERRYFFKEEDLCEQSTLGRGPGGQATNRRMQTAIVKHKPTGIVVKFSKFSSYWLNRRAARELLNLRLEEQLLGSNSTLGRIKSREKKRRFYRFQTTQNLIVKGNVVAAKASQQRDFYSVLTGLKPFPPLVMRQLGHSYAGRALYVFDLFEGECNNWWPMLATAFSRLNSIHYSCDGGGKLGVKNINDSDDYADLKVPELLCYLFPAVLPISHPPNSVEKYELEMIKRCASDEAVLRNVVRGLRCFVELFGLCLHETHSSANGETGGDFLLSKDGLNWLELRKRMLLSNGKMDPLALVCFSHLLLSLVQLRCMREANAILTFFSSEAETDARENWAMHGWRRMRHVFDQALQRASPTTVSRAG